MHIAVQKMELLLSLLDATGDPDLTAGTHGPVVVDEQGTGAAAGAYSVSWQVVDAFPAAGAKKITITVTHTKANDVRAQLVTYYKY
jgi:hypothetical protein